MVADMLRILFQVNEMLEDVDMPQINAAVVASAEASSGWSTRRRSGRPSTRSRG
jgi:hypothetical protein